MVLRTGTDDEATVFVVEQAVIDAFAADGKPLTFFRPFDGFGAPPLPRTLDGYRVYREAQLSFVADRSQRVANWVDAKPE